MSPFYVLANGITIIPIDWATYNVKVNCWFNDKDAGYSENNGRVVLPLAFLPPSTAEIVEEILAE